MATALDRTLSELCVDTSLPRPILRDDGLNQEPLDRTVSGISEESDGNIVCAAGLSKEFDGTDGGEQHDDGSSHAEDLHIREDDRGLSEHSLLPRPLLSGDGLSKEFHGNADGLALAEDGRGSEMLNDHGSGKVEDHINEEARSLIEHRVDSCEVLNDQGSSRIEHVLIDEEDCSLSELSKEFHGNDDGSAVAVDGGICEVSNEHGSGEVEDLQINEEDRSAESPESIRKLTLAPTPNIGMEDGRINEVTAALPQNGLTATSQPAKAKLVRLKSSLTSALRHHNIEDGRVSEEFHDTVSTAPTGSKLVRLKSSLTSAFRQHDTATSIAVA